VLEQWRKMGYGIALLRQGDPPRPELCDLLAPTDSYLGWAKSINMLSAIVLGSEPDCDWFVGGGDDTLPDADKLADEVAAQCSAYLGLNALLGNSTLYWKTSSKAICTLGVMQPTGDDWADAQGRIIKRFAGSPWLGREWCKRAYQGRGPLYPYPHCWADEELQAVAIKYGAFWQRPDLCQRHNNWARDPDPRGPQPKPLAPIITDDYRASKPLFEQRKAAGWPGSEPL
jgi:hypothetical protein